MILYQRILKCSIKCFFSTTKRLCAHVYSCTQQLLGAWKILGWKLPLFDYIELQHLAALSHTMRYTFGIYVSQWGNDMFQWVPGSLYREPVRWPVVWANPVENRYVFKHWMEEGCAVLSDTADPTEAVIHVYGER